MSRPPVASSPIPCVLDTDAFNEVDDQFALAHLLLSPGQVDLRAVYAAPFANERAETPAIGMEKSYEEIKKILGFVPGAGGTPVFRGSRNYLGSSEEGCRREAVDHLIEMARNESKLTVLGIGACTNLASALILAPDIASRIRLVWLGGHSYDWPYCDEFNLRQDPLAARTLFRSAAEMVWLPCKPVCSHLTTTVAELEQCLAPYSKLGAYLSQIVASFPDCDGPGRSKVIWDIGVSAYVIDPSGFVTREELARDLDDQGRWGAELSNRSITAVLGIERDAAFADFFEKARRLHG